MTTTLQPETTTTCATAVARVRAGLAMRFCRSTRLLPWAALTAATLVVTSGRAVALTCRTLDFDGQGYAVCEAAFGVDDLRMWRAGADGAALGTFNRIRDLLAPQGLTLAFGMNAGMYHPDRSPVGLYVQDGSEQAPLVLRAGPGNFGLKPNGVFCIGPDRFAVIETGVFAAAPPACRFATQSGPMLVIGGLLHPKFRRGSDSRNVRNGVGVTADGQRAVFAISDRPVNFDSFARLFRDGLDLPDALYLDGNISRLSAPALGRDDAGFPMGPVLGVVVPLAN